MSRERRAVLAKQLYGVSLEVLEDTPERALRLVRGIGTNKTIRAIMQSRGMTEPVFAQFWELIQVTAGKKPAGRVGERDDRIAHAIEVLDQRDAEILELIRLTCERRWPDIAEFLLQGLKPATDMEAVLNIRTILLRLDALKNSPEREATRKQDHEALALLAKRGLSDQVQAGLRELLEIAVSSPETQPMNPEAEAAADEAYVRALGEVKIWFDEWAGIAKLVVKRRDHLISLGLARRKAPKTAAADVVEPEPTSPGTNPAK